MYRFRLLKQKREFDANIPIDRIFWSWDKITLISLRRPILQFSVHFKIMPAIHSLMCFRV